MEHSSAPDVEDFSEKPADSYMAWKRTDDSITAMKFVKHLLHASQKVAESGIYAMFGIMALITSRFRNDRQCEIVWLK